MTETPTMRAYVLRRYRADGAGFDSVPRPEPCPGQVIVTVHASGLNPVDIKIRDGALRALRLHRLPVTLGNELSGSVTARHPGAQRYAPGTRVCLRTPITTMGAFAEQIAVDETLLSPVPDGVDDRTAAALPLAGLTAWQALHDVAAVRPGERVFVSAGAGGVGSLAIQLAKHAGAHVATTASPAGADLVRSLGADEVVNYREHAPSEALGGYDVAVDLLGAEHTAEAMRTLAAGGRLVSLSGPPEPSTRFGPGTAGPLVRAVLAAGVRRTLRQARRHQVSYHYLFMRPDAEQLDHLLDLVAAGELRVPLAAARPADALDDQLAELHRGHVKGKLVATWQT